MNDSFTLRRKIRYLTNYQDSYGYPEETFKDINYFTIFVSCERSGHSLVGSILDAHPNMIISHEIDALSLLKYHEFNISKVFSGILKNSYRLANNSARFESGYDYNIPYKYIGRFTTLKVIGDKNRAVSSEFLYRYPMFLDMLIKKFGEKLKVINIFRNLYDNIAAISFRNNYSIKIAINNYFRRVIAFNYVKNKLPDNQVLYLSLETLIKTPKETIKKLCKFFALEAPQEYIDACSSIIYENPYKRRFKVNGKNWIKRELIA